MNHFDLRDGVMHAEDVPLPRIAEEIALLAFADF